jgi:hypothetical protein
LHNNSGTFRELAVNLSTIHCANNFFVRFYHQGESQMAGQFLEPDEDGVLVPHPLGLVEMTNGQYHGSKGVSKSHLDAINRGDRYYWHRYLNPDREPEEQSPALIMGSAIHSAVLEPDLFPSEYVMAPTDINRRTNVGKEAYAAFEKANAGKTVLDPDDYSTCIAVRDAVHNHPVASGLLQRGKAEHVLRNRPGDGGTRQVPD